MYTSIVEVSLYEYIWKYINILHNFKYLRSESKCSKGKIPLEEALVKRPRQWMRVREHRHKNLFSDRWWENETFLTVYMKCSLHREIFPHSVCLTVSVTFKGKHTAWESLQRRRTSTNQSHSSSLSFIFRPQSFIRATFKVSLDFLATDIRNKFFPL